MRTAWMRGFVTWGMVYGLVAPVMADVTNLTWVGPTSGDALWDDAANWSPADVPDSGHSSNGERVLIGDATGDRTIYTPSVPTSIVAFTNWTQSSSAVNKIVLSNDLTTTFFAGTAGLTWVNSSGNAANMVLDLNGFTFWQNAQASPGPEATAAYTIISSTPGGVWRQRQFYPMGSNVVIGAGVTIEILNPNQNVLRGTWDPTSTLLLSGSGPIVNRLPAGGIGNLVIGVSTSTAPTVMKGFQSQALNVVLGDVTINSYVGAVGGDASDFLFDPGLSASINYELRVGGNFTDAATDNSSYGGAPTNSRRRTITFNGGAGTQRTLSIGRTGLVNDFAVGDSDDGAGNVLLAQDLTTTGRFTLQGNSIFNVNTNTLTSGEFIGQSGLQLQYSFGAGDGLIDVDGPLTLPSSLTIEVTALGGPLAQGHKLFTFDSYSGPSDLSTWSFTGDVSPLWSAEFSGNSIILVPEPSVAFLAVSALILLGRRRMG